MRNWVTLEDKYNPFGTIEKYRRGYKRLYKKMLSDWRRKKDKLYRFNRPSLHSKDINEL